MKINTLRPCQLLMFLMGYLFAVQAEDTRKGESSRYSTSKGQWPFYGGDLENSKYSPSDRINRETIKDLKVVWVWNSPDDVIKLQLNSGLDRFKATPLMVDGILYVRTSLNIALDIDAETGATLWGGQPGDLQAGQTGRLRLYHPWSCLLERFCRGTPVPRHG